MANHGIIVQAQVQAMNIDALNRSVIADFDIDNGNIFALTGKSTTAGEAEVWVAATPTGITNMWMACEPEVVTTVSGTKKYKGINPDVRDFYNLANTPFTAFKPVVGDLIELSADALGGTKNANTYVVAVAGSLELTWGASAVSGLSLKLIETTYISIPNDTVGSQRQTAYLFEVEAVA